MEINAAQINNSNTASGLQDVPRGGGGGSARLPPDEWDGPYPTGRSRDQSEPERNARDDRGDPPPHSPEPNEPVGRRRKKKKKKTYARAGLTIATLNIKGYGHQQDSAPLKWTHINQIMRDKKIAIMAIQETHMDEQRQAAVENTFGRRLHITASADTERPTQRAGIALVLNKSLVDVKSESTKVIQPGRAILTSVDWGGKEKLTLLAVYAPNAAGENAAFWRRIKTFFESHPRTRKPDIMLGDFNMVEDAIDRNPTHGDSPQQTQELMELKSDLGLRDGWRQTYQDKRSFTFMQPVANGGAKSRIDRIYVTGELLAKSSEWYMDHSGLANTDHLLVSTRVTNVAAPLQGDGRWCIPERVVEDKAFRRKAKELIEEAWKAMEIAKQNPRTEVSNAQKIYASLKFELLENGHRRDKIMTPKIIREISTLRKDLQNIDGSEDPSEVMTARLIAEKIADLEKRRHNKIRSLGRVKNRLEGETNSRYWMQINKELKPRDMKFSLKDPNKPGNEAETVSKKMAELAKKYHDELQLDGRDERDEIEREISIRDALAKITTRPSQCQQRALKEALKPEEITQAIQLSENNSAPGLDGATNLLWKRLIRDDMEGQTNDHTPTIVKIFTETFNDIENHGLLANSRFAEGWMCPIYKKNERDNIANYRPVTLLNTDYKFLTKALSL
ncbi:hypothetical protein PLEOSDRAFT_153793 [Pleurotus ostreatus PC15]|uniref:Endonuclease/exonuclease/phosphatase domain-containing protein n=1 Tax=Pleurotus ostreatus (strain PC15) TaxID=1137138 RepID=A0A067NX90_PLEO1|nr:hypothetical protein PLEOSDRAFT_153793 [Pleurotus ostreatus PC15]